jgi:hypothetical protein
MAAAFSTPVCAEAKVVARSLCARVLLPGANLAAQPAAPLAMQPRYRHDRYNVLRPLTKLMINITSATTRSTWIKPLSV